MLIWQRTTFKYSLDHSRQYWRWIGRILFTCSHLDGSSFAAASLQIFCKLETQVCNVFIISRKNSLKFLSVELVVVILTIFFCWNSPYVLVCRKYLQPIRVLRVSVDLQNFFIVFLRKYTIIIKLNFTQFQVQAATRARRICIELCRNQRTEVCDKHYHLWEKRPCSKQQV